MEAIVKKHGSKQTARASGAIRIVFKFVVQDFPQQPQPRVLRALLEVLESRQVQC